jgi:hypothetical protein
MGNFVKLMGYFLNVFQYNIFKNNHINSSQNYPLGMVI